MVDEISKVAKFIQQKRAQSQTAKQTVDGPAPQVQQELVETENVESGHGGDPGDECFTESWGADGAEFPEKLKVSRSRRCRREEEEGRRRRKEEGGRRKEEGGRRKKKGKSVTKERRKGKREEGAKEMQFEES